ncbi:hypothetical protein XELAEV_18010276mg [Xenopus laevis]|uniref:Ig-like domain-containing protein n=1 Tax=Xenopus laevis TaxID=8355 RepID=A0A974DU85_XENLA|nr:hypothetical protein XELAEV_18010276mg [Xenopus laevis]
MELEMRISAVVLTLLTGALGQYSVNQQSHQFVPEGDSFQINCSYTGTEYSIQWYRQTGNQPLQAIGVLLTNGHLRKNDFTLFLDNKERFTFLYLNISSMEDSAVYYCAVEAQWHIFIQAENNILMQGVNL